MANTFRSPRSRNIGTSAVQVGGYVVPTGGSATLIGAICANKSVSAVTADVFIRDASANDTYIVKAAPIPSGGSLIVAGGDLKVVLEVGDKVMVQSSVAASLDAIVSMLEVV
jgi:hypothetical protein